MGVFLIQNDIFISNKTIHIVLITLKIQNLNKVSLFKTERKSTTKREWLKNSKPCNRWRNPKESIGTGMRFEENLGKRENDEKSTKYPDKKWEKHANREGK